ncbi:segregation/condensation protein A [Chloroflexi bacterium TSY]|nr:segregation/condensation protein A [Chloroflexi bacterium TSY]
MPSTQVLNTHTHNLGAAYPISLPAFEGPLDLLLHLIERDELDVSEVSLVAVTDDYLKTLGELDELEPGALADFLVIASRLMLLKSRRLLPRPSINEDEDEEDPGDALIRQLLEYRKFKEAANMLKERVDAGLRSYFRTSSGPEIDRVLDLNNVDLDTLQRAVRRALQRIPSDPPMPTIRAYTVTVSEQIENVRRYLLDTKRTSKIQSDNDQSESIPFSELLSHSSSRLEVIVTFLAVLELIKQDEVQAMQEDTFSEIMLVPVEISHNTLSTES